MPAIRQSIQERFEPMLALPPLRLEELNQLLFVDSKVGEVVKKLQKDFGLYKDLKPATLRRYLFQYKEEFKDSWYKFNKGEMLKLGDPLPPELQKELPKSAGDTAVLAKYIPFAKVKLLLKEYVPKFDSYQEMGRLGMLQMDRVCKLIEYEGMLSDTITKYIKEKDAEGKAVETAVLEPLLALHEKGRYEVEAAFSMMERITKVEMDLGIRHKEEKPSQHLHIEFQKSHKELLDNFNNMKELSAVTAEALQLITTKARTPTTLSDDGDDEDEDPSNATEDADESDDDGDTEVIVSPRGVIVSHGDTVGEIDITDNFDPDEYLDANN